MTEFVFALVIASEILLVAALVWSIVSPDKRVWPPPRRRSWQFWFTWAFTWVALGGTVLLGLLDWNTFIIPAPVRFPLGVLLLAGGLLFGYWGFRTLGVHASLGLGGEFVLAGPYRWSRNPQYVGDIVLVLGFGIFCNSLMVLIVGLLGASCFALAPFAEEPWLRQRFGGTYDEYAQRVPRFVGIRRCSEQISYH